MNKNGKPVSVITSVRKILIFGGSFSIDKGKKTMLSIHSMSRQLSHMGQLSSKTKKSMMSENLMRSFMVMPVFLDAGCACL